MTVIRCGLFAALVAAQSAPYPPPFTREGAIKMLDNDSVITQVDGTKRPVTPAGGAGNDEREVRAVERLWNDARAKADIATLDRILVDEWTVTHANGATDTKARYLADLKSGARKFTGTVEEKDVVVRFYGDRGDTAIVTGSSDSTVSLNGQAQGGALHFTRVFVKRNGSWVMVVTQATTRPQ